MWEFSLRGNWNTGRAGCPGLWVEKQGLCLGILAPEPSVTLYTFVSAGYCSWELKFSSSSGFFYLVLFCFHPEKAMAPHSSTLAWKIPWMEEPGGLQSMGSLSVRHNWATSLSLVTFMHCRRKWQSTPVFLPGESQGGGSLVGCHLWGLRVGHDWSDLAAASSS